MELHPILEKNTPPNPGLWYVLSATGDCPTVRVGHTCSYIPSSDGASGKLYVIGGANPDGSFAETYVLDLNNFVWDTCVQPGFKARYEHSAFVPKSHPNKIYIFGGAAQNCNYNDIQVLDTESQSWSNFSAMGTPPSPRTYHTSFCVGDKFVVYSGGQSQTDPVGDRQVHCFDATTGSWSTLTVHGDPPKPRHGHLVVALGNKVYFHGGMSGVTFYDDLHILDLERNTWTNVKQKKIRPSARAAHGGFVSGTSVYVFGGMSREGAMDDMYRLDTTTMKWSRVNLDGPAPACRLDFALCTVQLSVPVSPSPSTDEVLASSKVAKEIVEQQIRMGSAGSVRSLGSAGSQHSVSSVGSNREETTPNCDTPPNSNKSSPQHQPVAQEVEGATAVEPSCNTAEHQVVNMCLVLGGMDTQGEIFDDCLVMLVPP